MSKKMFTIGIPCIFTGILFVVVMSIYGLNNVDETMAKASVKEAFAGAYSDFVESEVDVTKLFELYSSDKFSHLGTLVLNDTALIDNAYLTLIKDVPIEYNILRIPETQTTKAGVVLGGDGNFHFEGYINQEDIIFKLSEFNESYFSIPNSNIKETYKESLWFNLLGDITATIPDNFSLDLYSDINISDYVLSDYLKACVDNGQIEEIIKGVSFEKNDFQRDFFVVDTYVAANEYTVKLSKKAMEEIFNHIAEYTKLNYIREYDVDKYEFKVYISEDNCLLGAKLELEIPYNEIMYDTEIFLSFLGIENIFNKVIADITFTGHDKSVYSFRLLINNSYEGKSQDTTFILAMNQPHVSRICEIEIERNVITKGFVLDAALNIPGLKGNINYTGVEYDGEVLAPEDAYDVYGLNLWQILNIYSSTNWSFIK
ncbi:MAG: hypothetical protein E7261_04000 [Lachnospiraceae bacterium]|nr:hypothetical protein [Lachnospiraceae bacterium]